MQLSRSWCPSSFTGDIMGDLNAKRGKIQGMEQIGGGKQRINALGPAGRGRALRDRPALDDRRPRRVHDDVLPLRGDAVTPRVEGDRGVPAGPRGSPQDASPVDRARPRCSARNGRTASSKRRAAAGSPRGRRPRGSPRGRPGPRGDHVARCGACPAGRAPRSTTSVGTSISPSRWRPGGRAPRCALSSIVELVDVVDRDLADRAAGLVVVTERRPDRRAGASARARDRRPRAPPRCGALASPTTSSSSERLEATRAGRDRHERPHPVGVRRASKSIATPPPIEHPTSAVWSTPRASSTPRGRARARTARPVGRLDRP